MTDTTTRAVRLPALTTELETAELLTWLVAEGDSVREGDPLAEVTTDKVEMELPSPYDGEVAELLVEAGAVVPVGADLLLIATTGSGGFDLGLDASPDTSAEAGEAEEAAADAPAPTTAPSPTADLAGATSERVPAPPAVRRQADELGIDLQDVTPTGSRGQVTPEDLEQAAERRPRAATPAPAPPPGDVARPPARPTPRGGDDRRRAMVRAATARSTTRSQQIPQFTLFRTADLTGRATRRDGVSWTTLIAQALAATLWRHPELNAVWDEEHNEIVQRDTVRIGLAVDTPTGLVVTTLDDPDRLHGQEADARLRAAAARARDGKLTPEDLRPASATLSNLGGFGVERFSALLLPPQASILSVGTVSPRPVARYDAIAIRTCVELGLTIDHRVADGADGARFLETLVETLEQR